MREIGEKGGIKANTDAATGTVKFASAHDLRRSFGARWANLIMPQQLRELMRHESIDTTMRYYVGRNAQTTADALWEAYRPTVNFAVSARNGLIEEAAEEESATYLRLNHFGE